MVGSMDLPVLWQLEKAGSSSVGVAAQRVEMFIMQSMFCNSNSILITVKAWGDRAKKSSKPKQKDYREISRKIF